MYRSWVCQVALALLAWLLPEVSCADAGVLTFVELSDLALFPEYTSGKPRSPVSDVRNQHHATLAALKTQEWARAGKRLDFAAVLGLGLEGMDLTNGSSERLETLVQERLSVLASLPVRRLLFLPGTQDIESDGSPVKYRQFLVLARTALPHQELIDLTADHVPVGEFTVVGLNGVLFTTPGCRPQQVQEVERVSRLVHAGKNIVLFSYVHDLAKGDSKTARWDVDGPVRAAFLPLLQNRRLLGAFGAPEDAADWSVFGAPHNWRSDDEKVVIAKAWRTPCLTGQIASGMQFVSVATDGNVKATPIPFPRVPADVPLPEKNHLLVQGDAYLVVDDFDGAITAYKEAQSSNDPNISAQAAQRLQVVLRKKVSNEQRARFDEGDAHLAAEDYDHAIKSYEAALASGDSTVASRARTKLDQSLLEKNQQSLGWRCLSPKWVRDYRLDQCLLFVLVAGILFTFRWWSSPFAKVILYSRKSKWEFRMLTTPSATVAADLFADEFFAAVQEIGTLATSLKGQPTPRRLHARGGDALDKFTSPLDISEAMAPAQLKIGGIDVGAVAKMIQKISDYFAWRLEVRVGLDGETPCAYATLRGGARIAQVWRVPKVADDKPASVRSAGRDLAFEVFSEGWVRS